MRPTANEFLNVSHFRQALTSTGSTPDGSDSPSASALVPILHNLYVSLPLARSPVAVRLPNPRHLLLRGIKKSAGRALTTSSLSVYLPPHALSTVRRLPPQPVRRHPLLPHLSRLTSTQPCVPPVMCVHYPLLFSICQQATARVSSAWQSPSSWTGRSQLSPLRRTCPSDR